VREVNHQTNTHRSCSRNRRRQRPCHPHRLLVVDTRENDTSRGMCERGRKDARVLTRTGSHTRHRHNITTHQHRNTGPATQRRNAAAQQHRTHRHRYRHRWYRRRVCRHNTQRSDAQQQHKQHRDTADGQAGRQGKSTPLVSDMPKYAKARVGRCPPWQPGSGTSARPSWAVVIA
jgi:hypothetical protein